MADHSITLTPAMQNESIQWTMSYDGKVGSSPSTYPVIDLKAKEGHKLTYTIVNPEGLSINFDQSKVQTGSGKSIDNVLWIQANSKPSQPVLSDQIKSVKFNSSTELVIKDKNSGAPVTLVYRINFVDAANPGTTVTPLDPDLKNGGGNTSLVQNVAVVLAVVGVVLIAGLLFRRFARPSREANPA